MNHRLALAAAVVASLLPAASHAAPARTVRPQIVDPAGDWSQPWKDLLATTFSSPGGAAGENLLVRIRLSAPPEATTPANYWAAFWVGCTSYGVRVQWAGVQMLGAELQTTPCNARPKVDTTSSPATVRVDGQELVITVPLHDGLRRGTKLESLAAAALAPGDVYVRSYGAVDREVTSGDIAYGDRKSYVIGSERARR